MEGDDNSIGLAEQLVKGIGVFSGLYTLEGTTSGGMVDRCFGARVTEANNEINEFRHSNSVLVLKPELRCLGRSIQIICGLANGISKPLILQRGLINKDPVAIRTLLFRAQEYMMNCKKALSIAMSSESPYKGYTKNGNLPSGMVHDDYLMMSSFTIVPAVTLLVSTMAKMPPPSSSSTTYEDSRALITHIMPETWFFPAFCVCNCWTNCCR